MVQDIGRFVVVVVRHWQGLLTGGAITGAVLVYVVSTGQELPRWFYLVLFLGIFFPMSCFQAWRDEHHQARQLDDRRRQQEKADEYAPLLQRGRDIRVKWVDAGRQRNPPTGPSHEWFVQENATQRAAAFDWLATVKALLEEDFGAAVATHFNLGKPASTALDVSEPMEHESRVVALDALIVNMRSGLLPLRVRES
jgi:hypothetical protein